MEGGEERNPGQGAGRIVRDTAFSSAARVVSVVASFVYLPLLIKAFTLADYGVLILASAITGYAALLDLGAGAVVTRMVAEILASGEESRVGTVVGSATVLFGAMGVLAGTVMIVIGLKADALFAVEPAQASLLRAILFIGAASQLFSWPAGTANYALAGYQRFDILSATSAVGSLAGVAGVVLVLVLRLGPIGLMLINTAIGVVALSANVMLLMRIARGRFGALRMRISVVREILRSSLPLFGMRITELLGRQETDRVVIGIFLGPAALGIYEIAAKLSSLVTQVCELVGGAIVPQAASMNAQERHASLRALFQRGARYAVIVVTPIIVVLMCIAAPFITVWFGPKYTSSVPVAYLLLVGQILIPLYLIGDPILIGKDRYGRWLGWAAGVAALNVALSVWFVRLFGVVGVALATAIATWVEMPLFGRLVVDELGVTWREWLAQSMLPAYPLLLVPAITALAGVATPLANSMIGLFAIGVTAVSVYWLLAWRLALPSWERTELVSAVRSMFRRR